MNDFIGGFVKAAKETPRRFFAPLTALYFALTRPGGYLWHIKALYRVRS